MAYKKPQIVAKSAAKQSFVAGCPTNKVPCNGGPNRCAPSNATCFTGPMK
jgi:hypothetical protein